MNENAYLLLTHAITFLCGMAFYWVARKEFEREARKRQEARRNRSQAVRVSAPAPYKVENEPLYGTRSVSPRALYVMRGGKVDGGDRDTTWLGGA